MTSDLTGLGCVGKYTRSLHLFVPQIRPLADIVHSKYLLTYLLPHLLIRYRTVL